MEGTLWLTSCKETLVATWRRLPCRFASRRPPATQLCMCARGLRFEHKDLQLALDAAAEWAKPWRFHFAAGPQKSAVMCFGRGRARLPEFHVDGLALPVVKSYKYLLRIVLQSNLGLRQHVDSLLSRGEGKMALVHFGPLLKTCPYCLPTAFSTLTSIPVHCLGLSFCLQVPSSRDSRLVCTNGVVDC